MAPVMELAETTETEPESAAAVAERHWVLIAAAVAAALDGRYRILDIQPAEDEPASDWKHGGRISKVATRPEPRPRLVARIRRVRKEKRLETSHHA